MFISYMLQFLDKGTLGNAALFTLEEDTVSIGVVVLLFEKRKRWKGWDLIAKERMLFNPLFSPIHLYHTFFFQQLTDTH